MWRASHGSEGRQTGVPGNKVASTGDWFWVIGAGGFSVWVDVGRDRLSGTGPRTGVSETYESEGRTGVLVPGPGRRGVRRRGSSDQRSVGDLYGRRRRSGNEILGSEEKRGGRRPGVGFTVEGDEKVWWARSGTAEGGVVGGRRGRSTDTREPGYESRPQPGTEGSTSPRFPVVSGTGC